MIDSRWKLVAPLTDAGSLQPDSDHADGASYQALTGAAAQAASARLAGKSSRCITVMGSNSAAGLVFPARSSYGSRLSVAEERAGSLQHAARQSDIPALPSTLVQVELLLKESSGFRAFADSYGKEDYEGNSQFSLSPQSINLSAISKVVLGDLGATLQILRLAGAEFELSEERPRSIEHCLANFDSGTWLDSISAAAFEEDGNYALAISLWEHARIIAEHARAIAENLPDVNPDEAYLAGLLHDLGKLPAVLGWDTDGAWDSAASGVLLAKEWALPQFIVDAVESQCGSVSDHGSDSGRDSGGLHLVGRSFQHSRWAGILAAAHQSALQTLDDSSPLPAPRHLVKARSLARASRSSAPAVARNSGKQHGLHLCTASLS